MEGVQLLFGIIPVVVILLYIFFSSFRILREYERAVIFRFGRRTNAIFNPGGEGSGPGLVLLIPFIDKMVKVSNAEGEFQAAAKVGEAAEVLMRFPIAVQLRYLQTMREVASERNPPPFFPLPLDLFPPLLRAFGDNPPPKS